MLIPPVVGVPFSVAEELAAFLRREMTATERRDCVPFSHDAWRMVTEFEAVATRPRVDKTVVTTTAETTTRPILSEVSVSEAAEIEGVSRQAVQRRIDRKTLPARRDGRGHWRVDIENLTKKGA